LGRVLNLDQYSRGHAETDRYLGSVDLDGHGSLHKPGIELYDSRSWSDIQSGKAIDHAASTIDLGNSSAFTRPQVVKTFYLHRSTSL
jgi:hypothetical protein